jgi:hypothetical protein
MGGRTERPGEGSRGFLDIDVDVNIRVVAARVGIKIGTKIDIMMAVYLTWLCESEISPPKPRRVHHNSRLLSNTHIIPTNIQRATPTSLNTTISLSVTL